MSSVRIILLALICASPVLLLSDGLVAQGFLAGIIAIALAITAWSLRQGETEFFISLFRLPAAFALVPALWMVIQVLPLGVLAHPVWKSVEKALGHPVLGTMSVDLGASVIALGQYLSMMAVAFLSAAVAVDRRRADWVLFALTAAGAIIALISVMSEPFPLGVALASFAQPPAIDCTSLGILAAAAACVRTLERYATRHSNSPHSPQELVWTLVACGAALSLCAVALLLRAGQEVLAATGCGLLVLACTMTIRWFELRLLGATTLAALSIACAILLLVHQPFDRDKSLPLAFATSSTALSERLLSDAPLVGTGAGTFAALAPIYREIDDPPPDPTAATMAASIGIELGKPMLWLIVALAGGAIIFLVRASLQRGRDSFYPAMGASCLTTLLLLAFVNAGVLGAACGLMTAAAIGLAFAQSKSRTHQS